MRNVYLSKHKYNCNSRTLRIIIIGHKLWMNIKSQLEKVDLKANKTISEKDLSIEIIKGF